MSESELLLAGASKYITADNGATAEGMAAMDLYAPELGHGIGWVDAVALRTRCISAAMDATTATLVGPGWTRGLPSRRSTSRRPEGAACPP